MIQNLFYMHMQTASLLLRHRHYYGCRQSRIWSGDLAANGRVKCCGGTEEIPAALTTLAPLVSHRLHDSLIGLLKPFGIRELMRTGRVAMARGAGSTGGKAPAAAADSKGAPDVEAVP